LKLPHCYPGPGP